MNELRHHVSFPGGTPRLSVIIPAYNVERFMSAAMNSVLSQSYRDLELIVVDDGSTDGTAAVVAQRAAEDPRVRLIRQPNAGRPSIPRNRGIKEARGEIIAFLDGDDWFLADRLSAVVEVFDTWPDVDIVLNDLRSCDDASRESAGTYLRKFGFPDGAREFLRPVGNDVFLSDRGLLYRYASAVFCPMLMPTVSIRAHRLRREPIWFREDMRCGEDIDLWFRLLVDTAAAYIDRPLAVYRYRSDSTTQDRADFYLGTLRAHEMNLAAGGARLTSAERARYVRRIADRYQHLGYHYLTHGDVAQARASYRQAFRTRPQWRVCVKYLKTFVPAALRSARRASQSGTSPR
jgi:glycosyltransferase involved in cell wall biosynthesis